MFTLLNDRNIVAVIGFQIRPTLCYGRFVGVCDLITDSNKKDNLLKTKECLISI